MFGYIFVSVQISVSSFSCCRVLLGCLLWPWAALRFVLSLCLGLSSSSSRVNTAVLCQELSSYHIEESVLLIGVGTACCKDLKD